MGHEQQPRDGGDRKDGDGAEQEDIETYLDCFLQPDEKRRSAIPLLSSGHHTAHQLSGMPLREASQSVSAKQAQVDSPLVGTGEILDALRMSESGCLEILEI